MDLQIVPGRIWAVLFSTILLLCESATADVVTYLDFGGTWRYFPGVSEASTPDPTAWRAPNFDDGAWATGIAPFGYGRNPPYGTDLSTLEPPMRNNYTTVFLRGTFEIAAPDRVGRFVANAVFDGTDALMLSGETAIGKYPVESIATMATIAARAESAWLNGEVTGPADLPSPSSTDGTIAYLGHVAACRLKAAAIVTYTQSGSTARRLCRHRPPAPILALTPRPSTQQRLALSWGVAPVLSDEVHDEVEMSAYAVEQVRQRNLAQASDNVVILAGIPLGMPGITNLLRVEQV